MTLAGVGLGWRPETAALFGSEGDAPAFAEVVAESLMGKPLLPEAIAQLAACHTPVVAHGIGLGLGDPRGMSSRRLDALARVAERIHAPLVSEHIAFVRAGDTEIGHLTAVPRTEAMLALLIERIAHACRILPVPLALENIASLVEWPESSIDESTFIATLLAETPALLLLDLSNLYANAINHGFDPQAQLASFPIAKIAYVHVAGGKQSAGLYHDTHAHALPAAVLDLVSWLAPRYRDATGRDLPVMLERDARFPGSSEIQSELRAIEAACRHDETRTSRGVTRPPRLNRTRPPQLEQSQLEQSQLEERQHLLARALRHGETAPAGFDGARIAIATDRLAHKRQREQSRCTQLHAEEASRHASLAALSNMVHARWPTRVRRRITAWLGRAPA